jgi:hypothetical protein
LRKRLREKLSAVGEAAAARRGAITTSALRRPCTAVESINVKPPR